MIKTLSTLSIILILSVSAISFRTHHGYKLVNPCEFKVLGSSNLKNWDMQSTTATGNAKLNTEGIYVKSIDSLFVYMRAESLKSGKNMMDEIAWDALNYKKHPTIKYQLSKTDSIIIQGKSALIYSKGILSISGKEKQIQMLTTSSVVSGKITFEGETKVNMSDYNISPPVAMAGMLKVSDQIKIKYKVTLNQ